MTTADWSLSGPGTPSLQEKEVWPMAKTREQLIDWLVDDTFDTCRQDDRYMRSILQQYWSGMSDEELQCAYDDLVPDNFREDPADHDVVSRAISLRFNPQAWIDDYAVSVDAEHPDTWTVPLSLLLERFPTGESWHERDEDRDAMRLEGNAPRWVRDWTGPFEVELLDPDAWQIGGGE
ncbi:hypothetical protein GG804_02015 [Sphingomonas histidinilytica]|uniref:hypothetical protein n=1 Tax=Rhizorhabdus histidinilytica TaxID=439228 RepID=UPI001ADADFAC|nr:hypothetical protein [Rhizorhabdus histidinilytica]MBO9375531.1 hypothetical protein [Rhizorhabdus histidinilytica]